MDNLYNSTFLCTYVFYDKTISQMNPISKRLFIDNPNLHEEETNEELLDMSNILYQQELLTAFNLEESKSFDETNLNNKMEELYNTLFIFEETKLNNNYLQIFNEIMTKTASLMLSEDIKTGFIILFSYDYFHIFHLCLCDLLNKGIIKEENINALIQVTNSLL